MSKPESPVAANRDGNNNTQRRAPESPRSDPPPSAISPQPATTDAPSLLHLIARSQQRETCSVPTRVASAPLSAEERRQVMIRTFTEVLAIANEITEENDSDQQDMGRPHQDTRS